MAGRILTPLLLYLVGYCYSHLTPKSNKATRPELCLRVEWFFVRFPKLTNEQKTNGNLTGFVLSLIDDMWCMARCCHVHYVTNIQADAV